MNGYFKEKAPDINSRASEGVARRGIEPLLPPWEGGVFLSFVEGDANYSNNDCSKCVVKFAGVLNRISINHALQGQRLKPFRDSVSSFGENVDASLSNSVVAKNKQAAFV